MTHSPLPWSADLGAVLDSNGQILTNDEGEFSSFADAAFICRAVNAHDDLVQLLQIAREYVEAVVHNEHGLEVGDIASGRLRAIDAALAEAGA